MQVLARWGWIMVSEITIRSPYATRLVPFNSASNALSNGTRGVAFGDPMAICETITRGCHGWYVVVVGVVVVVVVFTNASVIKRAHIGLKPGFPPFCFGARQTTTY